MSVIKDVTRGIAPYAVLAGIGVIAWFNRDKIIGWLQSAIAAPISGAVGGVVSAAQEATKPTYEAVTAPLLPQIAPEAPNISFHDVVGMSVPGFGIVNVVGKLKEVYDYLMTGPAPDPPTDTFVSALQPIPTEADILWQAKLAEVGPAPSGPAPSGYTVRGTSLTGAPLYAPVQQMIGTIPIPDAPGTTGEVWQLGPSKLVKVGDVWLGENISACYLSGGWWDAPHGRCVYA